MKCKTIFLGAIAALFLVGCTVSNTSNGVPDSINSSNSIFSSEVNDVPRYEGMVISRSHDTLEQNVLKKDPHKDHDNWGHNKDTIETDITDLVDIDIQTDDKVKYYVRPNETFVIEVHLLNPQEYEIQSFTLNGKKYANYMFLEGSTMEILRLQATAPSTSGYFDYTIDAIKYIDGTTIKDVDMSSGDKTIRTGISYETAPSAIITSYDVGTTYINLGINVSDDLRLTKDNPILIYLTNGEQVVGKEELVVGSNQIQFINLMTSCMYQYGIVTAYDLIDGRDLHEEWLLTNVFKTLGAFEFKNVIAGKTDISFEVERIGEVGSLTEISVYDASTDEKVKSVEPSSRYIDGLLSNHTYNIYADYRYVIDNQFVDDYASYEGAKTIAKITPNIVIDSISADKSTVSYSVSTMDADATIKVCNVELIRDGIVEKDNGSNLSGKFSGLLSNSEYVIRVSYLYDLNDGQGMIRGSVFENVKTDSKIAPTVSFSSCFSDKNSISYEVSVTDVDETLCINKIDLLRDNIVVKENGTSLIGTFANLLSNNSYCVRVQYSYDLNDGSFSIFDSITYDISTLAKTAPIVQFESVSSTKTSINYQICIQDLDNTLDIQKVALLRADEIVAENDSNLIGSFDNLLSNCEYYLDVVYLCDLNDGNDPVQYTVRYEISTGSYITPHLSITNVNVTEATITSDYVFYDKDSISFIDKVELYQNNDLIATNLDKIVSFSNLEPFTDYEIRICYKADFNDGQGLVSFYESEVVKTSPTLGFLSCKIANTSSVSEGETIYLQATLDNPYNVMPVSAIVNGVNYKCANSTTSSRLFVEIVNDGSLEGGMISFEIQSVIVSINNKIFKTFPNNNNLSQVFINGRIDLIDAYIVDDNWARKELPYYMPDEMFRGCLLLDNSTDYSIDEIVIVINGSGPIKITNSIHKIDANHWAFAYDYGYSNLYSEWTIKSVRYSNDTLSKLKEFNLESFFYKTYTSVINQINSKNDLMSVGSKRNQIFSLNVDIDLSGKEWECIESFDGILLGNNHTISGIEKVGTVEDVDCRFGLFENATGLISDLNISDSFILLDIRQLPDKVYHTEIGFLSAYCYSIYIQNVHVTDSCSIEVSGVFSTDYYSRLVGGMVGSCSYSSRVINCSNESFVYSNIQNTGGLIGYFSGKQIDSCTNFGNVYGESNVGGIVGGAYNCVANNLVNNGSVTGGHKTGGIIGEINQSKLSNLYNNGIVIGEDGVGGIAGSTEYCKGITNCVNSNRIEGIDSVGGIIGDSGFNMPFVTYCTNNGEVYGQMYCGGIVGDFWDSKDLKTFEECKNKGNITCVSQASGGIIGYCGASTLNVVKKCLNEANVTSNWYAGGIIGLGNGIKEIEFCTNRGQIIANSDAGGIIGCSQGTIEALSDCSNYGTIVSNQTAAGIIGNSYTIVLLSNCDNYGSLSSQYILGGIVGTSQKINSIINCHNYCDVDLSIRSSGNLYGYINNVSDLYIENCTIN